MAHESEIWSAEEREIEKEDGKRMPIMKKLCPRPGSEPQDGRAGDMPIEAPETINKTCTSLQTYLYLSRSNAQASSSEIIRAAGSIISKAPLKAPSFVIFNKKSAVQEDSARL
ncbi:hypothetical protein F2Q70_00002960 [Brassica cretica]|uniref:Uncharacterized protein n=1 Tax=Brassica cretica TaxID=69181 RepID=A0A8S9IRI0_BRACR|nr:hypothetical protein F2Q70_00002960 [Brassica cretica]